MRIALFNLDGEFYAIEDMCTHDGGPLVEGEVVNECQVQCPRHGARFDIRTGAAVSFPAFTPTNVFEVHIEGDDRPDRSAVMGKQSLADYRKT